MPSKKLILGSQRGVDCCLKLMDQKETTSLPAFREVHTILPRSCRCRNQFGKKRKAELNTV